MRKRYDHRKDTINPHWIDKPNQKDTIHTHCIDKHNSTFFYKLAMGTHGQYDSEFFQRIIFF